MAASSLPQPWQWPGNHAWPLVYCLLLVLAATMPLAGAVLPESSPFHVFWDSAEGVCPRITPKACCKCRSDKSSQLAGRGKEGGGCRVGKVEGLCLSTCRALCWSELPLGLTEQGKEQTQSIDKSWRIRARLAGFAETLCGAWELLNNGNNGMGKDFVVF